MKKIFAVFSILLLLGGCSGFRTDSYIQVEPHDEGYEVAIDSSAVTVSSYLGLKNAMADMVEKCVTDGVIRAEGYGSELTEDLDNAVYEIWRVDPLGAYAVDYMTYDCSKIVNYYEIHIHITFRRTEEEIASVVYASSTEELKERLRDAMADYSPKLLARVNDYQEMDYVDLMQQVYEDHPEFALERPKLTVSTYPENGSQRILEFDFTYDLPQNTLLEMQREMQEAVDYISKLYGSANDDAVSVRRFYNRVIRDGVLLNDQDVTTLAPDSAYGALVNDAATSFGYAQTYRLLLRNNDIPCVLIRSTLRNEVRYLCLVTLEEKDYYLDVAEGVMVKQSDSFLMTQQELEYLGYILLE